MPNIQVQLRRGTTTQHSSFAGAQGEVTVDTDLDTLMVHTGGGSGTGVRLAKHSELGGIENGSVTPAKTSFLGTVDEATNTDTKILSKQSDGDYDSVTPSGDVTMTQAGVFSLANDAVTSDKISATDTNFNVTAAGNVGIGKVNSDDYQLEIDGDISVVDTSGNNPVATFSGTGGSVVQLKDTSTTGSNNGIYNLSSSDGFFAVGAVNDNGSARTVLLYLYPKASQGGVLKLPQISTADLNAAQTGFSPSLGMIAYVTDGNSGSPCLAVHDGSSFKRVALGTTISAT